MNKPTPGESEDMALHRRTVLLGVALVATAALTSWSLSSAMSGHDGGKKPPDNVATWALKEVDGLRAQLAVVMAERDSMQRKAARAVAAHASDDIEKVPKKRWSGMNVSVHDTEWIALRKKLRSVQRLVQKSVRGRPRARIVLFTAMFRQKTPAYFPFFVRSLESCGADVFILGGDAQDMQVLPSNVWQVPIDWADMVHLTSRKVFGGLPLTSLLGAQPYATSFRYLQQHPYAHSNNKKNCGE